MIHIRIYDSWFAETASLTDDEKGRLIDSLVRFAVTDEVEPPPGNEKYVYHLLIERIRRETDTHEKRKAERKAKQYDRAGIQSSGRREQINTLEPPPESGTL